MYLRKLIISDAEKMLEWMHDPLVVDKLAKNFLRKTIKDCIYFISHCNDNNDFHLAIVDDNDNYQGTVSLKNITHNSAEFSIAICRDAMGTGISIQAMNAMLKKGFRDFGLEYIYWCVSTNNIRALEFYSKYGFKKVDYNKIWDTKGYTEDQISNFIWFKTEKKDFVE